MSSSYTIDEIIALVNHSSLKINIFVEGNDDEYIYRQLVNTYFKDGVDFINCNGRSRLIEIFKLKNTMNNKKVIFIADKDMYIFRNIPEEYSEIIFTKGYSIENDLIFPGDHLMKYFSKEEKEKFEKVKNVVIKWFAYSIIQCLRGNSVKIDKSIYQICNMEDDNEIKKCFEEIGFDEEGEKIYKDIIHNYNLKLRGKQLMELYVMILTNSKRRSKYGKYNILEMSICEKGNLIEKEIIPKIKEKIRLCSII